MGADKAALRVAGDTLLARVVRVLASTVDEVVVVGRPGQTLSALPSGARRVDDDPERAGRGPLVGLLAGLKALQAAGIVRAYVGCVDAPLLTAAHVDWMLARLEDPAAAAIPEHEGRSHPLAGAVRVAPAVEAAEDLLAADRRSAHALFERLGAVHVHELPDPRVLWPCNTREEWEAIQRELER